MAKTLPEVNLKKSVCEIWQEKLLFDYTLNVEDEEFRVHKVIMASVSDYFKAMLTGGMVESQTDRVKLQGLKPLAVSNIIEYIYTNEISGTKASAEDLLASAVYLQIPSAIEAASQLLNQEVNEKNCFDILQTFQSYSLKEAAEKTEQYIKDHVSDVLKVNRMSSEILVTLVRIWDKPEWNLFLMVKLWAEVDFEKRKQHLTEIFSHLNFHLLSPAEIEDIRKMRIYTKSKKNKKSWHGLLDEAMDYHNLPTYEKVNYKPPLKSKQSGVCFYKGRRTDIIYKLESNNQWSFRRDIQPIPDKLNGAAAVIEVDNFLIVCGQVPVMGPDTGTQNWYIFDPRTCGWTEIDGLNTPRSEFALVYDTKHIYALGGEDEESGAVLDTIERYDLDNNTWTVIQRKLPVPLQNLRACFWSQYMFVTGGSETGERNKRHSQKLSACDTNKVFLSWEERSPMPSASPCHLMDVMRFNNEEVIVTMNEDLVMQYYNLRANQWSALDCSESTRLQWYEKGAVIADRKDNSLYLLNFYCHDDDSSFEMKALSVRWSLSADSEDISEEVLNGLPDWDGIGIASEDRCIFAVLAFPARSIRAET